MSEQGKGFTVTDRRHFTRDGEVRPDEAGSKAADRPPAAAIEPPPAPPVEPQPVRGPGADFGAFLVSLASQAALLLQPDAHGDRLGPDLEGLREFVSIFEMLRDKTQGRRTPEEDRILEGILYELRMAYLGKGAGGA